MLKYAILNIKGKQYKALPNIAFKIDWVGSGKKIEAEALVLSDGKVSIGKPNLAEKITLEVKGDVLGTKVRVSKFHAKANYRRVTGIRPKYSEVVWSVKKP